VQSVAQDIAPCLCSIAFYNVRFDFRTVSGWPINSFLLTKWYLDCVTENGETAIVYSADLCWKTLSLRYGSLLTVLGGKIGSASAVHGISAPVIEGETISLSQPGLDIAGTWKALRTPIRRTVFENPRGSVDWNCLQPMSQVEIFLQNKTRLAGLGYAECLTLSLLPWRLPLTSLNWGRYISPEDAIVWIEWLGPEPKGIVVHNGEEHVAASISESEVVFANSASRLALDRGLVLREGRLGDTVFPGISRLAGLLPRTMLSVHERKWRSRGEFHRSTGQTAGWAIHEVVKWRK